MAKAGLRISAFKAVQVGEDEPVYTSGVVCRVLSIPVWVLKQLDRERVVSPQRAQGHSRLYSRRELERIDYVWYYMRVRGVNVSGVKVILEMQGRASG